MQHLNEWEKVKIVRCVKDPMLPGQKPRQAIFIPDIPDCDCFLHVPTGNVWFHFHKFGRRMMVGIGNIELVEIFEPELPRSKPEEFVSLAKRRKSGAV